MFFDLTFKLNSQERLVGIVRKHWFIVVSRYAEYLVIISLLIIFANKFVGGENRFNVLIILIAGFVFYFIYIWILLHLDYYVITSERILKIKHKGAWNRIMSEVLISDIVNITLNEKGIAAMFFKFGSIKLILKNSESFSLSNVADAEKIYQGLVKLSRIKKA